MLGLDKLAWINNTLENDNRFFLRQGTLPKPAKPELDHGQSIKSKRPKKGRLQDAARPSKCGQSTV